MNDAKCVLLIDSDLSIGLLANTAAVLALTIGKRAEGIIGPDVVDGSGIALYGDRKKINKLTGNLSLLR